MKRVACSTKHGGGRQLSGNLDQRNPWELALRTGASRCEGSAQAKGGS
jgi:hypothetical protein